MRGVNTMGAVVAALLPFLVVGLSVFGLFRWQRQRASGSATPVSSTPVSRVRALTFLGLVLVVSVVLSGSMSGWALESLFMPVGWLATGLALYYGDRLLDHHVQGRRPKIAGPIPFWWVFVWAMALGWGAGVASDRAGRWPAWVEVVVLACLTLAGCAAFCLRFGLRLGR